MSFTGKFMVAIAVVFLACNMGLPFASAQARVYSNVLQLDGSGAYLGIEMEDVTVGNLSKYKLNAERGVVVRSVIKGSPADTAGIKEEDVILEFGGYQVWSSMQLSRLVRETPVGRNVELVVSRSGKNVNLRAKLEEREGRRASNVWEALPEDFFGRGQRSFQFRWPEGPDRGSGAGPTVADKPRLGVALQPLTDQLAEYFGVPTKKGALVSSVIEGSPSVGKLKSGDVIISADGKDIETPEDLSGVIRDKSEGSLTLKVIRDKKEITVVVNLKPDEEKGYKL
ncbi:MAG: PDZ domain-containing protein [Acidobacteria bacterium]|nr:PDZ domain-containing protein [Acidobacteriota bacterium]